MAVGFPFRAPGRMEGSAPGASGRVVSSFLVVFLGFIVVALVVYEAQFDPVARWAVALAAIGVAALSAWRQVERRSGEPPPLVEPRPEARPSAGRLAVLTAAVDRADRGLPYSQSVVAARARHAFAARLRLHRGLSEEEMRSVQADPERIRALVGDAVLADFLAVDESRRESRDRWVERVREAPGFSTAFRDVLRRMEAWR